MVQVFVAGTAPDYPGQSHTTITSLLTAIRDTFTASGWSVIADTIATTQDFTVQNVGLKVFLRILFSNDHIYMEGSIDNTFTTVSSQFSCGRAREGDDTRLYMNCNDEQVGIACWSNFYNIMEGSLAGYPNVKYNPTLALDTWWIGQIHSQGWMYAEASVWLYDNTNWNSWNVAHSNETTNLDTFNTYTCAAQGSIDRHTVNIPYQLDNDIDNDRNAGYYWWNGQVNGVDDNGVISPMYWVLGRNDDGGDDGDYGSGETLRAVPVNKKSYYIGYWNDFAVGGASYEQRTIGTDDNTGFIYVSVGGFKFQFMRIA